MEAVPSSSPPASATEGRGPGHSSGTPASWSQTRNPERLAWIVLVSSFVAFCLLVALTPLAVLWYADTAMAERRATLEILNGTVLLQKRGSQVEVSAANRTELREGDRIRTAANSQAVVWLFEDSNIRLWPETTLVLESLRRSRFNDNSVVIVLAQHTGHTRVEVALPTTRSRRFQVDTPQAHAFLREGSYRIELASQATEVTTRYGSASVTGAGKTVELLQGERTWVEAWSAPLDPQPAARDLVVNGDFTRSLTTGWVKGNRDTEGRVAGDVALYYSDGRNAARFMRQGSGNKHDEVYLFQQVNQDVSDFQSLKLSLEVKLGMQSLSGGGWAGTEYPLLVRVRYRDVWGSEFVWIRGFFYQNTEEHPVTNGILVPQDMWRTLAFDLFDPTVAPARPVYVVAVEIAASGWDFESVAANIRLIGE